MEIETQCLYAGYSPKNGEPQTLPICQSTTFKYESTEQVSKLFDLEEAGFFYTRLGNPTVDAVEQKIAMLEGGVGALCTASGQAATTFSHPDPCRRRGSYRQFLRHLRRLAEPVRRDAQAAWH